MAQGTERVGDGVDDQPVLVALLGRRGERAERCVAAAGDRGSRHRPGLHRGAAPSYQQLRARAHEPVARVHEAAGLLRDEPTQQRTPVEGHVRVHEDLACQHDLRELAPLDRGECGVDRGSPAGAGLARPDGETGGRRRRGGRRARRRAHELTRGVRVEGQRSHGQRAGAGESERVVRVDRGERVDDVCRCDACDHAAGDDARPVVQPREAVRLEPVDDVAPGLHLPGDGAQRGDGGHARVPVRICTEPPVSVAQAGFRKPASVSNATSVGAGGRYAVDLGRYR